MIMETEELQGVFIDGFYELCRFQYGCNRLQNKLDELGIMGKAEVMVGKWLTEDKEFKEEFEKAKKVVERINAEKAQDFLTDAAHGKKKKDEVPNPAVVAAHMVLEAFDKAKWGQKVPEKKSDTKQITMIIKHHNEVDTRVDVIDSPEVKELPVGDNDDTDG